jgi:hypothetical protein
VIKLKAGYKGGTLVTYWSPRKAIEKDDDEWTWIERVPLTASDVVLQARIDSTGKHNCSMWYVAPKGMRKMVEYERKSVYMCPVCLSLASDIGKQLAERYLGHEHRVTLFDEPIDIPEVGREDPGLVIVSSIDSLVKNCDLTPRTAATELVKAAMNAIAKCWSAEQAVRIRRREILEQHGEEELGSITQQLRRATCLG